MKYTPIPILATLAILALTSCSPGSSNETTKSATAISTPATTEAASSTTASATPSATSNQSAAATSANAESDQAQIDRVAKDFAARSVTWNTATDQTETAAIMRAKELMTPAAAKTVIEPQRNSAQGVWVNLWQQGATSVPHNEGVVITQAPPPDTATTASRMYRMSWTWIDRTGKTMNVADNRIQNVYMSLTKTGDQWLISAYQTEQLENQPPHLFDGHGK